MASTTLTRPGVALSRGVLLGYTAVVAVILDGKTVAGMGTPGGSLDALFIMENGEVTVQTRTWKGGLIRSRRAKDVKYLAIEDGGTKTNVGAVVAFGVLGLGAKRQWTTVTIGFPDGDVVMAFRQPLQFVRTELKNGLIECPELEGRIVNGPPPITPLRSEESISTAVGDGGDALERLERLADLLDRGAIDDAEFARLKASLIDDVS
jgi:hypothetical protein